MNLHVGAGGIRLDGFLNVDIRPTDATDIIGHAGNLSSVSDGAVGVLYSHAVFEHVFPAHHLSVLREWKRVLKPDGWIVCLGLPDFAAIVDLYVKGARGIEGERFDLYEVFRFTHGYPESCSDPVWPAWKPDVNPNSAPGGYVPQLHKTLFDANYLYVLLAAAQFSGCVFNYTFRGEENALNLGFIASKEARAVTREDVIKVLKLVPDTERAVVWDSIVLRENENRSEQMIELVKRLDQQVVYSPPPSSKPALLRRVIRKVKSLG